MKKCAILLLALALPLLAACAPKNVTDTAAPTAPTLPGGLFVLQSVNGEVARWERRSEIEFSADMQVSGQMCNRFLGSATYENGVLTAPQMAMTMMLCIDDRLNQLERDFAGLLRDGARLSLEKDTLTLSGERITLVYTRSR